MFSKKRVRQDKEVISLEVCSSLVSLSVECMCRFHVPVLFDRSAHRDCHANIMPWMKEIIMCVKHVTVSV